MSHKTLDGTINHTRTVPRSLSTSVPASAQAAVSHHSKWSYVAGPGYPPLMGLTIGQVRHTFFRAVNDISRNFH